ncbi:MAG: 30S ribosome-binding factor RbfA [Solobacterium sp.]|nr:30S ribosome-binding factor RbfA [Solobacterium sp.]
MGSSIKQKRLEGIIRKNVTEIIQFDMKDPNVSLATITDVRVSNDHSYATIYVTFMGKGSHTAGLKALEKGKGFIRSQLAQRLDVRRCPDLIFKMDKAYEYGRHIDDIIEQIHASEGTEENKDDENTGE